MNMNSARNNQTFASHESMKRFGRDVLCAIAACILTVVLLGVVGESPVQAAQRAIAEQTITGFDAV
jgi:hypothetical protein